MTKLFSVILLVAYAAMGSAGIASAYSQDPRSCADPRTQYPSNPPCNVPFLFSIEKE